MHLKELGNTSDIPTGMGGNYLKCHKKIVISVLYKFVLFFSPPLSETVKGVFIPMLIVESIITDQFQKQVFKRSVMIKVFQYK